MDYQAVNWKVTDVSNFKKIAHEWQALNKRNSSSLLLDADFVESLLNSFQSGAALYLALGYVNEQLIFASILERKLRFSWQTFQPTQSPVSPFLVDGAYSLEPLLNSLMAALPGWALMLGITQLDPDITPRPLNTTKLQTLDYITTGKITLNVAFEDYWASRSKNTRQNVSKATNRLAKEGINVSFKVNAEQALMKSMVEDYGQLESAGWKAEQGKAINIDNEQGKFYQDMLSLYAPEQSEVWQYYYDDELVATDLCIHNKDTIILLKTTFNEDYKKHSPAFCMHVEGIKHCMGNNYKTIEFYGPAMQWHKKLTEELRTMYHITVFRYGIVHSCISFVKNFFGKS